MKAKKLIEVAMPIKEISAESVRDNRLVDGHIKSLHMWWARRPLPTCRAVVFASVVPDPMDDYCPQAFQDAVVDLLLKDSFDRLNYAPYPDIPYTAIFDPMEDNLRNRLLMFIGKFSPICQQNMLAGKATPPKDQLSDSCLIKWENKNNERILKKARKLIWVAHNAEKYPEKSYTQLSSAFESAYKAITDAGMELYSTIDRHEMTAETQIKEERLRNAIEFFQDNMPTVFDPFAGGGAIPLEAARLGCRSYGNDINPVAHIIEKGSAEYAQKYGKPISFSYKAFIDRYGEEGLSYLAEAGVFQSEKINIPNRLTFDLKYYADKILASAESKIGEYYPTDSHGHKLVALYWARTATCSNPTCKASIPILRRFYLADTKSKKIYLKPSVDGNVINFNICKGKYDESLLTGWNNRGNVKCPCCQNITDSNTIKEESRTTGLKSRLLAVIREDEYGKFYASPSPEEETLFNEQFSIKYSPNVSMERNSNGGDTFSWGVTQWKDLFTNRQLNVLNTILDSYHEITKEFPQDDYSKALQVYLAIWFDRIVLYNTSFGVYESSSEKVNRIFGRQAISMVFDYPESNPFCGIAGSAANQLDLVVKYIEAESSNSFAAHFFNSSSGEKSQFEAKSISTVVTDPPYYNAIAYADISDFFYVWLKQTLGDKFNYIFSTPKTPKSEECTALKHHHGGDENAAKKHFEDKLTQIFVAIEHQTSGIISIMFAHQSTEAWTTLCNSILASKMNISGSWAMDTELSTGMKTNIASLESSVTVACRPSERKGFVSFKSIKSSIRDKVSEEVRTLYSLGFRGADLLTACFGKAVSEFGNYETVEKSDGSEVTVAELLELARTSAFTALLRDFTGDDYTKFYIGWLQLNGMGDTDFDDAAKFTRVGMNVNIGDIQRASLLIRDEAGHKQHLASFKERTNLSLRQISEDKPLIDRVHMAMRLWKSGDRKYLLPFIAQYGNDINNEFWRVLVVLKELLPITTDDYAQASGLLQNAESLIRDSKDIHVTTDDGPTLFDGLE